MANWWESDPVAQTKAKAGGEWWQNDAVVGAQLQPDVPPAPAGYEDFNSQPHVPLYMPDGKGGEINVNKDAQTRAAFDATQAEQDAVRAKEQAAFDATRTPLKRAADTATFVASMPVRTLTKGEAGIGDAVGLVAPGAGDALKQSEADFARANQSGLEAAKAVGDVMTGIPMLSTMGAVPGQVLNTGVAAARQLPAEVRAVMRDTTGAAKIPGGPSLPSGAVPPVAPAATPVASAVDDLATVGQRRGVDVPRMISGSETQKDVAAALAGMPIVGAPVKMAYDKGLKQLAGARDAAVDTLGAAGGEAAGTGAKQGVLTWMRKTSDDAMEELYKPVYKGLDANVTRPLNNTASVVKQLRDEMAQSTSQASAPAIALLDEALKRPGGLNAAGLAELRTDIGRRIKASKTVPDASEAAYKRVYPALTKDLQETVKTAGGEKSLTAWNRANREANVIAAKRRRLSQIIGSKDDTVSEEKVLERLYALGNAKGGNMRNMRLAKEVIGEKDWGNVGAELVSRLGTNPKTGAYSAERFLTGYGKMSEQGKAELFGPAKAALDDIALLSQKFHDLDSRFNKSNTGKVTTMLKILSNPTGAAVNLATAAVNPLAAATVIGQGAWIAGGRRMAWHLASPATAKKASNMVRAFYNAESAVTKTGKVVARNEQELAASVRAYSAELARQQGGNAAEIEAGIMDQLNKARNGQTPDSN